MVDLDGIYLGVLVIIPLTQGQILPAEAFSPARGGVNSWKVSYISSEQSNFKLFVVKVYGPKGPKNFETVRRWKKLPIPALTADQLTFALLSIKIYGHHYFVNIKLFLPLQFRLLVCDNKFSSLQAHLPINLRRCQQTWLFLGTYRPSEGFFYIYIEKVSRVVFYLFKTPN